MSWQTDSHHDSMKWNKLCPDVRSQCGHIRLLLYSRWCTDEWETDKSANLKLKQYKINCNWSCLKDKTFIWWNQLTNNWQNSYFECWNFYCIGTIQRLNSFRFFFNPIMTSVYQYWKWLGFWETNSACHWGIKSKHALITWLKPEASSTCKCIMIKVGRSKKNPKERK